MNLKNTDRASYEQNQFNHSLEQIRCAMNKQCDLGRCGWREVDVVSEFPHAPVQPMVLELWLKPGTEPLRFSCGRKVTDVIRAWAVRNEQAVRLRLFPRCWTWLLRCATGTECDLTGVVDWGGSGESKEHGQSFV